MNRTASFGSCVRAEIAFMSAAPVKGVVLRAAIRPNLHGRFGPQTQNPTFEKWGLGLMGSACD